MSHALTIALAGLWAVTPADAAPAPVTHRVDATVCDMGVPPASHERAGTFAVNGTLQTLRGVFPSVQGSGGVHALSRDAGTSNYRSLSGGPSFYGTPGAPFQIPSVFLRGSAGVELHPSQVVQGGTHRDAALRLDLDEPFDRVWVSGVTGRGDTTPSVTWYLYSGESGWSSPSWGNSSVGATFNLTIPLASDRSVFFATNAGSTDTNDNATFEGVSLRALAPPIAVTPLRQYDSTWAGVDYGGAELDAYINALPPGPERDRLIAAKQNVNIQSKGCMLTALTMVLNAEGAGPYTPDTLLGDLQDVGGISEIPVDSAVTWRGEIPAFTPGLDIVWGKLPLAVPGARLSDVAGSSTAGLADRLAVSIARRRPVIVSTSNGAHWVVAVGFTVESGVEKLQVIDPGHSDRDTAVPVSSVTNARFFEYGGAQRVVVNEGSVTVELTRAAAYEMAFGDGSAVQAVPSTGVVTGNVPGATMETVLPILDPDADPLTTAELADLRPRASSVLVLPDVTLGDSMFEITGSSTGVASLTASATTTSGRQIVVDHPVDVVSGAPVSVTITIDIEPCPPDVDGNGVLNLDDIAGFAEAYLASDLAADLTGDGVLNLDDVAAFADAFLGGCQ